MTLFLYLVMVATWSTTWWAIHVSHGAFSPAWGAALRFIMAAVVMLPWMRVSPGRRATWLMALAMGTLGFTLNYTASYAAVALVPSGTAAVMFATAPAWVALWARVLLPGTVLPLATVVGLAVAVTGVGVMQGGLELPREGVLGALGWIGVGTQSAALSTIFARRAGPTLDSRALTARSIGVAAVELTLLALARDGGPPPLAEVTPAAWGAVAYLAVAGTCMTFTIYYRLVQLKGPILPATAGVVCPVLALFFGAWVGGEPLGPLHVGGAALTAAGVALTLWKPSTTGSR